MAKKELTTKKEDEVKKLILSPRLTEKASLQGNQNAYTFDVRIEATKLTLADEIKGTYKVSPKRINITNIPSQRVFVRGKWGMSSPLKKAIIFLKKGDSIKLA